MTAGMWRPPTDPNIVVHNRVRCPHCGTSVNSAAEFGKRFSADPSDGDTSICMRCERVGIYVIDAFGQVSIRAASDEETAQARADHPDTFAALRRFNTGGGRG